MEPRKVKGVKLGLELVKPIKVEFLMVLLFYGVMSVGIHWQISTVQPEPYMDEIFHIPQVQKYCRGQYQEWDPKITTLPGTYIVTNAALRTLQKIYPIEKPCSTFHLRTFNLIVSAINLVFIYAIIGYYSPGSSSLKRAFAALNIATFPVLYFFSFLYYTDTLSTAFLLIMHFFFVHRRYGISAMFGAYSVITRQTNIIWVFYHGLNSILQVLTDKFGEMILMLPYEYGKYISGDETSVFFKPKKKKSTPQNKHGKRPKRNVQSYIPSTEQVWTECAAGFRAHGTGYVLVGIAFLMFIVYNGSIVVGDKQAHQATFNFPQLGYFAIVFGTFTLPFIVFRIKAVLYKIIESPLNILNVLVLACVIVYFNTPAHPYLLADNRHYTFYIWKRFFESVPCFRFLWIPLYLFVWTFIYVNMGVTKVYWFSFFLCTALNIVPQLLLEFRYFIPAYLFVRMTFKNSSWKELILEFGINQLVNFATVYLFLFKPFKWQSEDDQYQRFMW